MLHNNATSRDKIGNKNSFDVFETTKSVTNFEMPSPNYVSRYKATKLTKLVNFNCRLSCCSCYQVVNIYLEHF